MSKLRHILVAEDDEDMRSLLVEVLRSPLAIVHEVADAPSLRAQILESSEPFDLIVSDIRLPGGSGLRVLEELRLVVDATPVVIMTAFSDHDVRSRVAALGGTLLDKPFDLRVLEAIGSALPRSP